MTEEFNNDELEFAPKVGKQEEAPIAAEELTEAPAPIIEEAPVEKAPKKTAPKKEAKKSTPKVEKKEPGMYYQGKRITSTRARLGRKWTVVIDGKRHKVLKKDIEIVK